MTRILVIDDDPFIGDLVSTLLSDPKRQIVLARNGAEGLGELTRMAPDVVLLDVGLPDALAEMVTDILTDQSLVWMDDYTRARVIV